MKSKMPNLQILRFFAAALVLVSHVQHEALKGKFASDGYAPWDFLFFAGGVDIFFVISGFIIYAVASRDFGQRGAALKFLMRRLVRVVPPYWIFTTAMIGAAVVFHDHVTHSALSLDHIIASYFFYPFNNAYGKAYPVLMLGYTLNFEMFFYGVFAAALLFSKRIGIALILGVIGLFGVFGLFKVILPMPFFFWSNTVVFEFLFGLMLAVMREKNWRISPAAAGLSMLLGVFLMILFKSLGFVGTDWNLRIFWMGVPALLICAGVLLARDSDAPLTPARRALVLLGDASYAIYLSHPFALNAVAVIWARTGIDSTWTYVFIASVFSIGVGVAVHLLIEKPLTVYLNRRVEARFGHRWLAPAQPA